MANRLEVEVTSTREDGTWTWRVCGARHPKGSAPADLLPAGTAVGDTWRVEAETDLDGITIVSILGPASTRNKKERPDSDARTIEVLGTGRDAPAGRVTTTLAGRGGPPRPPGSSSHGRSTAGRSPADGGRSVRPGRRARDDRPTSTGRHERSSVASGERPTRRTAPEAGRGRTGDREQAGRPTRTRPVRTAHGAPAGSVHRDALLAALSAEQRAVADKLVSGGLPAVRKAIDVQNAASKNAGHPEVPVEPIISMAESLLPRLKVATWCDRAEAVLAAETKTSLRDVRSLVNAADDVGRDEEGKVLLARLRDLVEAKVTATRRAWEQKIRELLDDGQVVRALKSSAQPPDPGARLPADLATSLAAAAGSAMTGDTPPPRWMLVLEAAATSPVRVNVRPDGIPPTMSHDQLESARRLSGRVPGAARVMGIALPPPPAPVEARPRRSVPRPVPRTRAKPNTAPRPDRSGVASVHADSVHRFETDKENPMSTDSPIVEHTQKGHIALLTINRPEARNAINGDVAQALEAAIDRIEEDDETWITVLTGAGTVFCAGADLKAISTGQVAQITTSRGGFAGFVQREREKPVIAAIDGPALAGGCEIALACDLIVASTAARFGLPEVKRALVAAAGGLFRLPRSLPRNVAMELALTGEPLSAERAHQFGLVNDLVPEGTSLAAAVALAEKICSNAPLAVRESRKIVLASNSAGEGELWKMSAAGMAKMVSTEDFMEGPRAFIEKRDPVWKGR